MVVAAFGTPGVMCAWGFAAVQALTREAVGEQAVLSTNSYREFNETRPGQIAVLMSQYPEPDLLHAAAANACILFTDSACDSIAYLSQFMPPPSISLVRSISASLSCLAPLQKCADVLLLHRSAVGQCSSDELVKVIGDWLKLSSSKNGISTSASLGLSLHHSVAFEDAARSCIDAYVQPNDEIAVHDEASRQLVEDILNPLEDFLCRGNLSRVVWPQSSFLTADQAGDPMRGPVELAGGQRCLIYGPYMHLPAGAWRARIYIGFADIYQQSFVLELIVGARLRAVRFDAPRSGDFYTDITFVHTEPQTAIEIRLLNESGAIEGRINYFAAEIRNG